MFSNNLTGSFLDGIVLENSSSIGEDFDRILTDFIQSDYFLDEMLSSSNSKYYFLNKTAPNPLWVYSSTLYTLMRITPSTELIPVDAFDKDSKFTECYVMQNMVNIPTKFITESEWH